MTFCDECHAHLAAKFLCDQLGIQEITVKCFGEFFGGVLLVGTFMDLLVISVSLNLISWVFVSFSIR